MSNLRLATMRSYAEAAEFLGGRESKKVGYNTVAHRRVDRSDDADEPDDVIAVRYHNTDIVTYHPDGHITLNTGGWETTTTTNRMHMLTPAHITVNRAGGEVNVFDRLANKTWRGIYRHTISPA